MTQGKFTNHVWAANSAIAIGGYGVLTFFSSTVDGPFSAVSVPFRVAVFVVAVLLLGYSILKGRKLSWPIIGFLTFLLAYTLRMYADRERLGLSQFNKQLGFIVGVCVVPALAMFLAHGREWHRALINYLSVLLALACVLGVTNITVDNMETGRLMVNQYYNPIDLGHAGLALLLISVSRLTRAGRDLVYIRNMIVYGAGAGLGGSVLALSGSRGPVTAGVVCITIFIVTSVRRKTAGRSFGRMLVFVATLVVAGIVGVSSANRYGGTVLQRVTSLSDTRTGDTESRLPMYQEAFDTMLENPIIGATTLVSYGIYPHNAILEAGMALGVPGALAMISFLWIVVRKSLRLAAEAGDTGLLGLLAIQQVVSGQFSGGIWSDDNVWTFAFLVLGVPLVRGRILVTRTIIRQAADATPVASHYPEGIPREA